MTARATATSDALAPDVADEPVVITGCGLVSAAGNSLAALRDALARRRHCLAPIAAFETVDMSATHAGEVSGFAPLAELSPGRVRTLDRGTQMAFQAAKHALAEAGLGDAVRDACGVAIGVSGSPQYQNMRIAADRAYPRSRLSALYAARSTPAFQADVLAHRFRLGGPRVAFAAASLGGLVALSHAMDLLRAGHAPAMLVGGGEINTLLNALGMDALGVTARGPCTPFAGRGGMCLGEGAVFFVLELACHAAARAAPALAELVATGISADAYDDMAPDPSGRGLARAVTKGLARAGIAAGAIGWVRACGTGHRDLDTAEMHGLDAAFAGATPPLTSTEPYFGHVNGLSPLLGLAAAAVAMRSDEAPCMPLAPDPVGGDAEPTIARAGRPVQRLSPGRLPDGDCLLTAMAFGGTNGAVIARRAALAVAPAPGASGCGRTGAKLRADIAIVGMGAVSALGPTAAALLRGLAAPVDPLAGGACRTVGAAALAQMPRGVPVTRRERLVRMALRAAAEALAGVNARGSARYGLLLGLARGPVSAQEQLFAQAMTGRFDIGTGRLLLRVGRFSVASEIAHGFGLLGYSAVLAPGVHGGVQLLAHGAEVLRASPDLDGLLVIAADEWTALMAEMYRRLGLLGGPGARSGAAYDPAATGCTGGEGAAALLLARRAPGERRDGDLALIGGTGFTGDTTARPDPRGAAYARAIGGALARAACAAAEVDIAFGSGCGWPAHDAREQAALAAVCPRLTLASVLPHTGLSETAGGLFGAIAAVGALRDGTLPAGRPMPPRSSTPLSNRPPPQRVPRRALLIGTTERGAHAAIVLDRVAA